MARAKKPRQPAAQEANVDAHTRSSAPSQLLPKSVTQSEKAKPNIMAKLGKINFSAVKTGGEVVPGGQYEALSKSWEPKQDKSGEGQHILAMFQADDEKAPAGHTFFVRWSLKEKALWRIKRDLLDMGTDPEALEDEEADLEDLLNTHFAKPQRYILTVIESSYEKNGETVPTNEVTRIEAA